MTNKIQKTFYGTYSQPECIGWLNDLGKCFDILSVDMKTYVKESEYISEKRCQIKVRYK